jgi:hypothetical protein
MYRKPWETVVSGRSGDFRFESRGSTSVSDAGGELSKASHPRRTRQKSSGHRALIVALLPNHHTCPAARQAPPPNLDWCKTHASYALSKHCPVAAGAAVTLHRRNLASVLRVEIREQLRQREKHSLIISSAGTSHPPPSAEASPAVLVGRQLLVRLVNFGCRAEEASSKRDGRKGAVHFIDPGSPHKAPA